MMRQVIRVYLLVLFCLMFKDSLSIITSNLWSFVETSIELDFSEEDSLEDSEKYLQMDSIDLKSDSSILFPMELVKISGDFKMKLSSVSLDLHSPPPLDM